MTRACLFAFVVACTGGQKAHKDMPGSADVGSTSGGSAMANQMKPGMKTGGGPFVKGAPLTPAKGLVAWFESQKRNGEPRLTRIPIVMKRQQVGFSMRGVRIGTAADALEVRVTDSALGVGLGDRARMNCQGQTCNFIVEGYWQGDQEGGYVFDVKMASQKPVSDQEIAAMTHAEVEGESGN